MAAPSTTRRAEGAAGQSVTNVFLAPSAQMALFGFNAFQTQLALWRGVSDGMRDSLRSQQDVMLRLMVSRSSAAASPEGEKESPAPVADAALGNASSFMTPAYVARRAYVQMSGAMIDAQRAALKAFVSVAQAH